MKVYLSLLVLLLLVMQALMYCPSGWISNGNLCYFLFDVKLDQSGAETFCQGHQGHLVSYKDLVEWRYISKLLELSSYGDGGSWTDLSHGNGSWTWNNQPYAFLPLKNWKDGSSNPGVVAEQTGVRMVMADGKIVLEPTSPPTLLRPFCQRPWDAVEPCDTKDGWMHKNNRCYKLFPPKNRVVILNECNHHKAKVFTPTSPKDLDVLKAVVDKTTFENGTIWINGKRTDIDETANVFATPDGKILKYIPWINGKAPTPHSTTNCLGWKATTTTSGFSLVACGAPFPFICVKDIGSCPLGWYQVDDQCYRWFLRPEHKVTWPVAVKTCKDLGTSMLPMNPPKAVLSLLQQELINAGIDSVWVGVQDNDDKLLDGDGKRIRQTLPVVQPIIPNAPTKSCGFTDANPKRQALLTQYCFDVKNYVCTMQASNSQLKVPDKKPCDTGWNYPFYNRCFKLLPGTYDFDHARDKCAALLATLPYIHNDLEQSFVAMPALPPGEYWLGLRYILDHYKWTDGSKVTYQNSPVSTDSDTLMRSLSCISVGSGYQADYPGRWIPSPCGAKKQVLCMASNDNKARPPTNPASTVTWFPGCGPGWVYNNRTGACYWVEKYEFKSWLEAGVTCRAKSAELVSVENWMDQHFLESILGMPEHRDLMESLWIGASNFGEQSGWVWSDRKPFVFTNWEEGQPLYRIMGISCALVPAFGDFRWVANDCSQMAPFVCKKYAPVHQGQKTTNNPTSTPSPKKNVGCKPNWKGYGDLCYFLGSQIKKTWPDARQKCLAMNADLADVNNREENNFMATLLQSQTPVSNAWISLHYDQSTSSFVLAQNATTPTYALWAYRQPSLNLGLEKQSVVITPSGGWINVDADDMHSYICKTKKSVLAKPGQEPLDPGCDKGWFGFRDECIQFSSDTLQWREADTKCKSLNATLAHVRDKFENMFMSEHLAFLTGQYWIAIKFRTDKLNYVTFQEVTNRPVTYTDWGPRKPDQTGACVALGANEKAGLWTNTHCYTNQRYICQQPRQGPFEPDPTPQPSTGKCPPNWRAFRSACFQFSRSKLEPKYSWNEALQHCRAQGADLASFHNNVDFGIFLRGIQAYKVTESLWIGLNAFDSGRGYQWIDQSPLNFIAWDVGQPNDQSRRNLCGEMHVQLAYSPESNQLNPTGISMRLQQCSKPQGWICSIKKGQKLRPTKKTFPKPSNDPDACGPDQELWRRFGSYCYYISFGTRGSVESKSWSESSRWCRTQHAHLVSINGQDENDFLWGQLNTFGPDPQDQQVGIDNMKSAWIGLNELEYGKGYRWSDGTLVGQSWKLNWNDNEPNNRDGLEACVAMQARNGKWNDVHCGLKQGFVCKRPAGPPDILPTPTPTPYHKKTRIPKGGCPSGFQKSGSKCFKLYNTKLTWDQAVHFCVAKTKGTLASISSRVDNDAVMMLLRESKAAAWLGLKRPQHTNDYLWADSSDQTFEAWDTDQPNSALGNDSCVVMRGATRGTAFHAGHWSHAACDDLNSFICQTAIDASLPPAKKIPSARCEAYQGYFRFGESCLKVVTAPATWTQASSDCGEVGGHLMTIIDRYDVAKIRLLSQNIPSGLWTGLNARKVSGVYEWDSLEPVTFTPWAHHSPDDRQGKRCVYVSPEGSLTNLKCGERRPYICQRRDEVLKEVLSSKYCKGNGFRSLGQDCYLTRPRSWGAAYPRAVEWCKTRGSSLASVRYANFSLPIPNGSYVWIGLIYSNQDTLYWYDGTPLAFTNWEGGQPAWDARVQQCVAMGSNHKWKLMDCYSNLGFICMKMGVERTLIKVPRPPTTPAPSTTTSTSTTTTKPTTTTPSVAPSTRTSTSPSTSPTSRNTPKQTKSTKQATLKTSAHPKTSNKPTMTSRPKTSAPTDQPHRATSSLPTHKTSSKRPTTKPKTSQGSSTTQLPLQPGQQTTLGSKIQSKSGLSAGAEAGIAIGGVFIVAVIAAGIFVARRKGYLGSQSNYTSLDNSSDETDHSQLDDNHYGGGQGQGQALQLRTDEVMVSEASTSDTHWQDPTLSQSDNDNAEKIDLATMVSEDGQRRQNIPAGNNFNSEC